LLQHKLKNTLSALSRDIDPVETPAGPMLVAMAEQPVLVTPDIITQQNLLNPHNQIVQTEQEDGLQQKQEEQLSNIDLHAVNQGIDLLNKYYPGLGQVTFQPVQQLLPTNPLIARQWANVPQDFSQDQSFENDKFPDPNVQVESLIQLTGTNSEDNSEPEFKTGYHQQAISNEVDALARLSETHAAQGCGGIIGKVINDPGGFTVGCQQMACSGRLPEWVTYSNKTDSLAKDLAGVSCSRNRKKFSKVYMQMYHSHPKEVEYSQRHFMNQVTVQLIKKITNKHGIDYDKLPLGTRQVLYSRVVQQQNGLNTILSRACGTHCGQLDGDTLINKIYDEIERGKDIYFKKTKSQSRDSFNNLFKSNDRMKTVKKIRHQE